MSLLRSLFRPAASTSESQPTPPAAVDDALLPAVPTAPPVAAAPPPPSDPPLPPPASSCVYFESQTACNCAVHACNNLMQLAMYTEEDFDRLASELNRESRAFGGEALADDVASAHRDKVRAYTV